MTFLRRELRQLDGQRQQFTGVFERFGVRSGWADTERTVLLVDVRDCQGHLITDHLWFACTQGFAALNLKLGDRVQFEARASSYEKGYYGHREDAAWQHTTERDYRLERPTKVQRIGPVATSPDTRTESHHPAPQSKREITQQIDWLRALFLQQAEKKQWAFATRENLLLALRESRNQPALLEDLVRLWKQVEQDGQEPALGGLSGFAPMTEAEALQQKNWRKRHRQ